MKTAAGFRHSFRAPATTRQCSNSQDHQAARRRLRHFADYSFRSSNASSAAQSAGNTTAENAMSKPVTVKKLKREPLK